MTRWHQGDSITPRWEVLKVFGGGMADVYIVYDREVNYVLAAKTYKDGTTFAENRGAAELFEREANTWVDLGLHENIAHAYFVHRIEQKPFIFIEYVDGGDLGSWIQEGRLANDMRQILRFAIQLCDGMVHAFASSLVAHCDLKPKNCLITSDGTLKVTDFGLAFFARDAARQGASGTPAYMAPEQWDAAATVDQRTDIYAFGVTLYEMISGRLPFSVPFNPGKPAEQFFLEFRAMHETVPPPPLGCEPPQLADVIKTCLAKARADRYPDFSAVRADLVAIYEGFTGQKAWSPAVGPALHAKFWSNRGASLSALGRHLEAANACQQAVKLDPNLASAWNNLATALLALARQGEDRDAALRYYREVIDACEHAIALDRACAQAYHNTAMALNDSGKLEDALRFFDKAMNVGGLDLDSLSIKINILIKLKRYTEAIAEARRKLELAPNSADSWFSLGLIQEFQEQWPDAIRSYAKAIELNPFHVSARVNLATVFASLGRWPDVISAANQALAIDPNSVDALSNCGVALDALGRHEEALAHLDRAVSLRPSDARLHLNRARPLFMLGRFREAVEACDDALARNAEYGRAFFQKGFLLERVNRQRAIECYQQALRLGETRAGQRLSELLS
jgi:tetratricopeptide (TPR) repeat protein